MTISRLKKSNHIDKKNNHKTFKKNNFKSL